jgi:hypothetical protein
VALPDPGRRRLLGMLAALGGASRSFAADPELEPIARCLRAVDDIPADSTANLALRIERLSAILLGRAYRLDPLGEGPGAAIDPDPLWSLDFFDCLSLVETVLALARSLTAARFVSELQSIRYRAGEPQFGARNHFMEIDWLPQNLARGVLADVTDSLPAPHALAAGVVTRRQWLEKLRTNPLQSRNGRLRRSPAAQDELRQLAAQAPEAEAVSLRYARLRELAAPALAKTVAALPHAAVLLIVRPNTSLFGPVGAVTQISHLGFVLQRPGATLFRHASSRRHRGGVIDVPLAGYLRQMQLTRSFSGIKVLQAIHTFDSRSS